MSESEVSRENLDTKPRVSLDQFIEAAWAGIDIETYAHCLGFGCTHQQLMNAYRSGKDLAELATETWGRGYTPMILRRGQGGFDTGGSRFTNAKLLKLAGVKRRDERKAVLNEPGLDQYYYRNARRAGVTHQECMAAHILGIGMKEYTIFRSYGFGHDEIIASTLQLKAREK